MNKAQKGGNLTGYTGCSNIPKASMATLGCDLKEMSIGIGTMISSAIKAIGNTIELGEIAIN
mgnify:FL=1